MQFDCDLEIPDPEGPRDTTFELRPLGARLGEDQASQERSEQAGQDRSQTISGEEMEVIELSVEDLIEEAHLAVQHPDFKTVPLMMRVPKRAHGSVAPRVIVPPPPPPADTVAEIPKLVMPAAKARK